MNITIYTTTTCGFCRTLKGYLQMKEIPFEEKIADQDPNLAKELYEKSGQLGVPLTVVEKDDGSEEMILGFDRPKVDRVIGIS